MLTVASIMVVLAQDADSWIIKENLGTAAVVVQGPRQVAAGTEASLRVTVTAPDDVCVAEPIFADTSAVKILTPSVTGPEQTGPFLSTSWRYHWNADARGSLQLPTIHLEAQSSSGEVLKTDIALPLIEVTATSDGSRADADLPGPLVPMANEASHIAYWLRWLGMAGAAAFGLLWLWSVARPAPISSAAPHP